MARHNQETGVAGERLAEEYLEAKGYAILERRYRFERAEVDLICFEPDGDNLKGEIVFVEVKTRRNRSFGNPEEAVTLGKQRSIIKAASAYLYESKMEKAACRFDVVAIFLTDGEPLIEHFKHAFDASED